jgi:hypothetical protein
MPTRNPGAVMACSRSGPNAIWHCIRTYADNGKTKQARTYAAQMLKGFEEYMQRHQQKGFASETEAGTIPWNPDVRCHVCNDSGYEYTEIPEPGCVGTVRRCKCKAMFAGVSA